MHWIYAHLIGDYLLQTDWMASKKKKSWLVCLIHVIFYMLPFFATRLCPAQLAMVAVQHLIQDKTNFVFWFFRHAGKKAFLEPPFAPWSLILLDNILHILWIAFVVWAFPHIS